MPRERRRRILDADGGWGTAAPGEEIHQTGSYSGGIPPGVFDGDLRLPHAARPLQDGRHHCRDVAGQPFAQSAQHVKATSEVIVPLGDSPPLPWQAAETTATFGEAATTDPPPCPVPVGEVSGWLPISHEGWFLLASLIPFEYFTRPSYPFPSRGWGMFRWADAATPTQ